MEKDWIWKTGTRECGLSPRRKQRQRQLRDWVVEVAERLLRLGVGVVGVDIGRQAHPPR